MNQKQAAVYAYIQKQYEVQVRLYNNILENRAKQGSDSLYYEGFMDGHFNGCILQLEMLADNNKLGIMAEELKSLYSSFK
ncbi:hypothetical protein Dtox_3793 [Desulfofarcimen acetoxidans DSM 771]|jgi:hypothetical protein|uniref:Uncharacterized protein n=1 Tax=Desulfofarcimen acetoxidans (strain ATCC 49208 / DSM 771 / KCTC 5769 / VKM B-1644 / 5575) TaxID=485916 RepID=C8VXA4_DESAS|nr:hypothetical protein [Desulfofarcimen acetoxidans]ACV64500.1 hypothetical protein Dtox_3793 [Desulfofarcimen acetoxidans DSM 771]